MTAARLLAACGLYCGACYHYRASFPEGRHLLEAATRQGKPVQGYACQGCRSEALYIHPGCAQCAIRACADAKGLSHCGHCADVPCALLLAFQRDGHVHHLPVVSQLYDLARQGADAWLQEQERCWTCACGAPFSWYEVTCPHCGAALESYGNGEMSG
jgi:hypothetical protein